MSQQINLISPLLLKKRYAFGLREMALGLGLILAVALAWAGYLTYRANTLEKLAAQEEARQAAAQQELDRLSAAATRPVSALLTERVKAAQARVAQREALLASMRSIIDKHVGRIFPPFARARAKQHGRRLVEWLHPLAGLCGTQGVGPECRPGDDVYGSAR